MTNESNLGIDSTDDCVDPRALSTVSLLFDPRFQNLELSELQDELRMIRASAGEIAVNVVTACPDLSLPALRSLQEQVSLVE